MTETPYYTFLQEAIGRGLVNAYVVDPTKEYALVPIEPSILMNRSPVMTEKERKAAVKELKRLRQVYKSMYYDECIGVSIMLLEEG